MPVQEVSHIKRNVLLLSLLWTGLMAASLAWNIYAQRQASVTSAHLQAEVSISKDISFRSWATSHGGVYVRPNDKSPPNPYLKVPDRDVVTTDGTRLTLINPAYMMRQVFQDFSAKFGINGHITSLRLMNPNNAPDAWEREALLTFERGAKEISEVVAAPDGKRILRYMRPFYVEQGCLKCHGDMGYKVGDIRGGISTIVHMDQLDAVAMKSINGLTITYGIVWLVGLLGIGVMGRRSALRHAERERNMQALLLSEQRAMALLALDRKADELDEKEFIHAGLEEAERLTSSQMSFLHFINDDQQTIELVAWSKRTKEHCKALSDSHYPLASAGVWADCARLKKQVMYNDFQNIGNKRGYPEGHVKLERYLSVPVVEGDLVRLIIGVGNKAGDYDETDTRLLQIIANDLWKVVRRRRDEVALKQSKEEMEQRVKERTEDLSITNARLSESVTEMQVHHHEMQMINRLNDMLQTCQTLQEAYRVIETSLQEIFGKTAGALAMLDASRHYMETRVGWGDSSCEASFALEDCWAMRQGHQHGVESRDKAPLCKHFTRLPQGGHLCLPLIAQGEITGLLYLEMRAECSHETYIEQQQLAETVGEVVKLGLSNIRLRMALLEQATHDTLTGLYNRRYLDESMPRELHRALRSKSPLCVVMIDMDFFKRINDTFGHEAGDIVLRGFGQLLGRNMRKSDIACRYGGEEFVIVMESSSLEDACQRAEQLRSQVKELKLQSGSQLLGQMTISAGVAQMPEQGITADKLLQMADEALYAAKQGGRDRVVVYKPGQTE